MWILKEGGGSFAKTYEKISRDLEEWKFSKELKYSWKPF